MFVTDNGRAPALGGTDFFDSLTSNLSIDKLFSGVSSAVSGISSIFPTTTPQNFVQLPSGPVENQTSTDFWSSITSVGPVVSEQASGFNWDTFLNTVGKAADIGTSLWSGAATRDIQVAQLELAKVNAGTEQARAQAEQLIALTQAKQLEQQAGQSEKTIFNKTVAGFGLGTIALGGIAAYLLLRKKGRR